MKKQFWGADVIARVRLVGQRTSWVEMLPTTPPRDVWGTLLEFRFQVHEYRKGSGPAEIGGIVYIDYYGEGEEAARAGTSTIADAHDARWDDREAVVFLFDTETFYRLYAPFPSGPGQYFFGPLAFGSSIGVRDAYTVASVYAKLWLPEATATTSTGSSARASTETEKVFLLDAPAANAGSRSSRSTRGATTVTVPTISLTNLKNRIASLEAQANAGGTPEYRACVENAYRWSRAAAYQVSVHGTPLEQHDVSIASGLPAGTLINETHRLGTTAVDVAPFYWYDGADKDIVRPKVLGPLPPEHFFTPDDLTITVDGHVTKRPLPAGNYTYFYNARDPICDLRLPDTFNHHLVNLTVTAPADMPRILHEAFFDPVAIGTAVGADGTNGVLKPASFSLDGTTTTITSLKWEDGEVTMALSPTSTSLADYAIDFIDAIGTTTLSLTSDNASTTALTWTVPDKPWSDGDLLMLRLHNPAPPPPPPVTVTITPRPEGRFTFFDLTVSWNDPQACDGRYFVYVGTDTWVIRNLGFHAASVSTVTYATGWLYDSVPDHWVFVRCD